MEFEVESPCEDPDIKLVTFGRFSDARGVFSELYRREVFEALGVPGDFAQDSASRSSRNVIRGLHLQPRPLMGKLVRVVRGRALLVARNVSRGSPYFGGAFGIELTGDDLTWVWAPGWHARGYLALEDDTEVYYKGTAEYAPHSDVGIQWHDPTMTALRGSRTDDLWPVSNPVVSERDRTAPLLREALDLGILEFDEVDS